jgi:hypothetical protein
VQGPQKESRWIKALKQELNTIIDRGTLNKKEQTKSNDEVILTTEANKIKLDQEGNVDKFKVQICVRGYLQMKKYPTMEYPHSPAASMRMSKILTTDAARYKSRIFQPSSKKKLEAESSSLS